MNVNGINNNPQTAFKASVDLIVSNNTNDVASRALLSAQKTASQTLEAIGDYCKHHGIKFSEVSHDRLSAAGDILQTSRGGINIDSKASAKELPKVLLRHTIDIGEQAEEGAEVPVLEAGEVYSRLVAKGII